jgi:hypothetical protein
MSRHRNPRSKVSNPTPPDNLAAPTASSALDVELELGVLQEGIGLADALIHATLQHFERHGWRCRDEGNEDESPLEHLHQLLCAARRAALASVHKGRVLASALVDGETRAV